MPVPYRTSSPAPIRKLRVAAVVGALAVILAPVVSALLARYGLPALDERDVADVGRLAEALYVAAGAAVTWIAAYRARPAAGDTPVVDREAGASRGL